MPILFILRWLFDDNFSGEIFEVSRKAGVKVNGKSSKFLRNLLKKKNYKVQTSDCRLEQWIMKGSWQNTNQCRKINYEKLHTKRLSMMKCNFRWSLLIERRKKIPRLYVLAYTYHTSSSITSLMNYLFSTTPDQQQQQ